MRCTTDNKKMHYIDGIFHIRRRAPTDLPPAPPPLIPPPLSLLGIICSFSQSTSFFGFFSHVLAALAALYLVRFPNHLSTLPPRTDT